MHRHNEGCVNLALSCFTKISLCGELCMTRNKVKLLNVSVLFFALTQQKSLMFLQELDFMINSSRFILLHAAFQEFFMFYLFQSNIMIVSECFWPAVFSVVPRLIVDCCRLN